MICHFCGEKITDPRHPNSKWCSEKCRSLYRYRNRGNPRKEEEMKKNNLIDVQEFSNILLGKLKKEKRLIAIPKRKDLFKGKLLESAILMLSDIHGGQVNKFLDVESGQLLTTYNTELMIKEFDRLLDGVFTVNQLLSASYQIDKLYIFGLGDYLENDVIYKGQRFFIDKSVGEQLVILTKVMNDFFIELLKMFQEIEFICLIGNHGRLQLGREAAPVPNNFDYLLGQMLKIMFAKEPRVKITVPESWYYLQKIYGWRYFLHHGDTVYSWMNIPYYGLKRQGTARRIEIPFDIECIGHFHHRMEIPISGQSITLVNGGWIDKSDFGWRKFGTLSHPEQIYFGVSPKRARSWCFNLDLLHGENELKELQRR